MPTEERVLCFERKLLEELGAFQGLSLEVEKYLPIVTASKNLIYRNRSEAEQDRRYKQLIPYVLLVSNGKILRYRRDGQARGQGKRCGKPTGHGVNLEWMWRFSGPRVLSTCHPECGGVRPGRRSHASAGVRRS